MGGSGSPNWKTAPILVNPLIKTVKPITSFKNPKVKFLRALRMRKYRQRERCFLAKGIRIVEEALTCGAPVETLVYAPDLLVSERARALVGRVERSRRLALSADVFRALSERDEPQGIAALIHIEDQPLATIPLSDDMLVIVAYQLRDPGNLGSIIRTADAAGATGVVVVGPSVDVYDPHAVRATMGSLFALPVVRLSSDAAVGTILSLRPRRFGPPACLSLSSPRRLTASRTISTWTMASRWRSSSAASDMACRRRSAPRPMLSCVYLWLAGPRHSTSRRPRRL